MDAQQTRGPAKPKFSWKKKWTAKSRKGALSAAAKKEVLALVKKHEAKSEELRYFDAFYTSTANSAGQMFSLTAIQPGDLIYNRTANQIHCKSLELTLVSTVPTGVGADLYDLVRYIIFEWKNDDTLVAPLMVNILDANLTSTSGSANMVNPFNLDEKGDYRILLDVVHNVQQNGAHNAVRTAHTIPLKQKIVYTSGSSVVTGVGNIYLLVLSDSLAAPSPSFAFNSRLRYTEE